MSDLYDTHPETGWPIWMEWKLQDSNFVLVVFTETYSKRSEGHEEPGRGLGVAWDADLIKQEPYESPHRNARIIPVVAILGNARTC